MVIGSIASAACAALRMRARSIAATSMVITAGATRTTGAPGAAGSAGGDAAIVKGNRPAIIAVRNWMGKRFMLAVRLLTVNLRQGIRGAIEPDIEHSFSRRDRRVARTWLEAR